MNQIPDIFWDRVRMAGDILGEVQDYRAVAPALREIVSIVRDRPELHGEFARAFILMIDNPSRFSSLVVQYCMYELRFPEIREHVENRLHHDPLKTDMAARHILAAYGPDWILAPLFKGSDGRK